MGRLSAWCRDLVKVGVVASCLALVSAGALAEVPVKFVDHAPVIDGVLDDGLKTLPAEQFPVVDSPNDYKPGWKPTYRIAYGAGFLYLYIEVPDGQVATRDRAYQNGDGFQLALTVPRAGDAPAEEFYVMGFTTSNTLSSQWQKKFVWYRNVDLAFDELKSVTMETRSAEGKTGIEVLLPWREVYPYHPWLSEAIGFNLCYVKAFGETAKTYFYVVEDDRLQSEQSARLYTRLRFEAPKVADGVQAYAVLNRNHIQRGELVQARVAVLSAAAQDVDLGARTFSGEGTPIQSKRITVRATPGLTLHTIELGTGELPDGGYSVSWLKPAEKADQGIGLTILPPSDVNALSARLERLAGRLKPGSMNTLRFQLQEIRSAQQTLKPYDTAAQLRLQMARLLSAVEDGEQGKDVVAQQSGLFRRAYRSKVDETLQPYTVRIPAVLDAGKRYPLVVFLHGSGQDDRALRPGQFPDHYIQLAPHGRGTSNDYTVDHAQEDIRDAIEDVMANYPVDPERVLLSGFSMGGYGVYRTFYQDPKRYRALAIFSGHPTMGRDHYGSDHPSFLEARYLAPFRDKPMFVFHGGKDRNCPIELTRDLITSLKNAGANVDFHYEEDKGHESPSEATMQAFRKWLEEVMK